MKQLTLLTLMILLFPLLATGQNLLLDRGVNAGSIGLGGGNLDGDAFYGINAGYSLNGRTDLFLSYEKNNFDTDADINKLRLGADHLIFKQGGILPLNLNVGTSYSFGSLSSDEFSALGIDLSVNELKLTTGLSHVIRTFMMIAPYASVDYNRIAFKASYGGDTETESDSAINFTLGGHFGFGLGSNLITLNPFYTFGDFNMAGLRLAFVLNAK